MTSLSVLARTHYSRLTADSLLMVLLSDSCFFRRYWGLNAGLWACNASTVLLSYIPTLFKKSWDSISILPRLAMNLQSSCAASQVSGNTGKHHYTCSLSFLSEQKNFEVQRRKIYWRKGMGNRSGEQGKGIVPESQEGSWMGWAQLSKEVL